MLSPDEIARVAAGLTKAQKRALLFFAEQWCSEEYADGRTLLALDRRGLTARYVRPSDFRDVRVTVTTFGLAVRAVLSGEGK